MKKLKDFKIKKVILNGKTRQGQYIYFKDITTKKRGQYFKDQNKPLEYYLSYINKKGKKTHKIFNQHIKKLELKNNKQIIKTNKKIKVTNKNIKTTIKSGVAKINFDVLKEDTINTKKLYYNLFKQLIKPKFQNDKTVLNILLKNVDQFKNRFEYHLIAKGKTDNNNNGTIGSLQDYNKKSIEEFIQTYKGIILPMKINNVVITGYRGSFTWHSMFNGITNNTTFNNKGIIDNTIVTMILRK